MSRRYQQDGYGEGGGDWNQYSMGYKRRPDRGDREWSDRARERERSRPVPGPVPGQGPIGRRYAVGQGTQQIEDVLQYIRENLDFMVDDVCVPVQIALQLMDSSSLGRAHQYELFQETYKALQRALRAIVNEHHQGFNSSIGTFHKIQSSIQSSQIRLRVLKESLVQAKGSLSTTKPELKLLAQSSQSYDDMLHLLGQIEQLQHVPEKLEARISEKRFLTAVEVLQEALRMMRKQELEGIGALSDLRSYLTNQESALADILIEELHNHLYLKSPYCVGRWKAYNNAESKAARAFDSRASGRNRPLFQFLESTDLKHPLVEDASRNPEADSLNYIRLLIEALSQLGQLETAISAVEQRMPIELFKVVDKTNTEVDQRHPLALRTNRRDPKNDLRGLAENDYQAIIMSDLLWTLYSKFEAVAEGHRVVHEIVTMIVAREGIKNSASLTRGFKELWKLYQSEIRSLLHDYLATDAKGSYDASQASSNIANFFQKKDRDKAKRMFKLQDMDLKGVALKTEQDDLEMILKASVPGLVSSSKQPGINLNETNQTDGSATGHKLLVEPSVFNMGLLLPPSLSFLQRLKEIVPPVNSDILISTLTSFLDDFLINVFHPQLEETLTDLSAQTYRDIDTVQEDPHWPSISRTPILKGISNFYNLITTFCRMLDTIPHDQAFSELIVSQMKAFYSKCYEWYRAIVVRLQVDNDAEGNTADSDTYKRSAALLEDPEINAAILANWQAEAANENLIATETDMLIATSLKKPIKASELMSDRKSMASLCLLYNSMNWLADKVQELRLITNNLGVQSTNRQKHNSEIRWASLDPSKRGNTLLPVHLPLSDDNAINFDAAVASYSDLAQRALLTIHTEIRCSTMYYLDTSLLDGNYNPDQPVHEPDPRILSLNSSLLTIEDVITTYLRAVPADKEYVFLVSGLAKLADDLLVTHSGRIAIMNTHGAARMTLHVLVLQQNLKNVERAAVLSRSAGYYGLFNKGADAIMAAGVSTTGTEGESNGETNGDGEGTNSNGEVVKSSGTVNGKYSFEELRTLLELNFSGLLRGSKRDSALQARRTVNEMIAKLAKEMGKEL